MQSLNRKKALMLVSAIADGEATEDETAVFFDFIQNHPDIREEYENALYIKHLLKYQLDRKCAPEHLRNKIENILDSLSPENSAAQNKTIKTRLIQELNSKKQHLPLSNYTGTTFRYLSAAAIIVLITLVTIRVLDQTTQAPQAFDEIIIENIAAKHFLSASSNPAQLLVKTHSTFEAEQYLSDHYGLVITVPEITGTVFLGISTAGFATNYDVPLLTYEQPDINETIYVFVLDVDDISRHKDLVRHQKAAENCKNPQDYFVAEIDNHHVVSWLWNNNWYTAVSNHNGYDLASLIGPLNPND